VVSPDGVTVWEVLNRKFLGTTKMNVERYALYQKGELTYTDWVALDVTGWRKAGATRDDIISGFAPLELVPGARETLAALRDSGIALFAVSGTLDLMIKTLFPDHPFEEIFSNEIHFDNSGNITGWRATPFDMEGKPKALRTIASRKNVPLDRCAFVGDSSNDVWMAREAGFTVAFNPDSAELEELAGAVVRSSDLRDILPHLLAPEGA
jgi:HAD superfamily phosphoserine phosphatase-like hydrolase